MTQITVFHSTLALSANIRSDGEEPLGPSVLRDANYMTRDWREARMEKIDADVEIQRDS